MVSQGVDGPSERTGGVYESEHSLDRLLGCLLYGAAAWRVADRDRFIGWDEAARQRDLSRLANNQRYLILPWVRVPHLASHLLAVTRRRVSADWQAKYGHPILLLETFVEQPRFAGTCYQADNWSHPQSPPRRTHRGAQGDLALPLAARIPPRAEGNDWARGVMRARRVDTYVRPTFSPLTPFPTVCGLRAIIEQQQRLIETQKITLEQRQLHIDQLRSTNEHQLQTLQGQQTQIDALKAEVARLKQLPKKPKIRPSTLPKDDKEPDQDDRDGTDRSHRGETDEGKGKPPKPRKRNKELTIHHTQVNKPEHLPEGSRLLGYEDYTVQDLLIQPYHTSYRLARYQTPHGKTLVGVLPEALKGSHFGITFKSNILYQYF